MDRVDGLALMSSDDDACVSSKSHGQIEGSAEDAVHKDFGKLAQNWFAGALVIYVLAYLLGQKIDPALYFGAFVGVPFLAYYGLYRLEASQSKREK